jgi:pimeloyl-ACP methyl ester carboxylesterase
MIRSIQLHSGVTLRAAVTGNGPALVFIHGLGGNFSFWANQARHFSASRRVVRYDLRGHGESSPSLRQDTFDHAEDLVALLDVLEIKRASLVGLSMGGLIAQAAAARFPDRIERLVLTGTVPIFAPPGKLRLNQLAELAETEGMDGVARAFVPGLFGSDVPETDPRAIAIADSFRRQDAGSFAAAARALALADVTPFLGSITAPTLLCYGENDRLTPPKSGARLAAQLADARLEIIPDAGHVAPVEAPVAFDSAVERFLGQGMGNGG